MPPRKKKEKIVNQVRFIRFNWGDDIIAEITAETRTHFSVKNPMTLITDVDMEQGKQLLVMFPWIPQGVALGNEADVRKSDVILNKEIDKDVEDYYKGMCLVNEKAKTTVKKATVAKASELQAGKNVVQFVQKKPIIPNSEVDENGNPL